ncbi:hypothetical protein [Pseudonocardia dioxanivorans]|uniref:hypothetical protein n=1 Tax=Pseudonocardia dioxanivorans TaxID=240495 RepID=UPI000CD2F336|nr:hypothetical protein [Pseudonocardia dioxanivorans]
MVRNSEQGEPLGGSTDLWGDVSGAGEGRRPASWQPLGAARVPVVEDRGRDDAWAPEVRHRPSTPSGGFAQVPGPSFPPAGHDAAAAAPAAGSRPSPVARERAVPAEPEPLSGPLPVVTPGVAVDGVLLGVIRRLRAQASRQAALAERLRANETRPGPLADLAELAAVARRTRRDSDTVLTLAGAEPVRRAEGPVLLGELLGEVMSGVEDAPRVVVAPPAGAVLAAAAADGLGAVLAELLAHTGATTAPGARIDLASHWTADGGLAVEVFVAGVALRGEEADELQFRLDDPAQEGLLPADRVGLFVAARLARRAGLRVSVRVDPAHPPAPGLALVAAVHCPAHVLVGPAESGPLPVTAAAGFDREGFGTGAFPASSSPAGLTDLDDAVGADAGFADSPTSMFAGRPPAEPLSVEAVDPPTGALPVVDPLGGRPVTDTPAPDGLPPIRIDETPLFAAASAAVSHGADALFGPLDPRTMGTDDEAGSPIYEEMASAWFRTGGAHHAPGAGAEDWGDDGGWAAAAQLAAESDELSTTASGLPRRQPGRQVVPPPRGEPGEDGVGVGATRTERAPDRVRMRLSSWQRGLQEGRHRAGGDETVDD